MVRVSMAEEVKRESRGSMLEGSSSEEATEQEEEREWERKAVLGPGRGLAKWSSESSKSMGEMAATAAAASSSSSRREEEEDGGGTGERLHDGVVGLEKGRTTSSATDGGEEEVARWKSATVTGSEGLGGRTSGESTPSRQTGPKSCCCCC